MGIWGGEAGRFIQLLIARKLIMREAQPLRLVGVWNHSKGNQQKHTELLTFLFLVLKLEHSNQTLILLSNNSPSPPKIPQSLQPVSRELTHSLSRTFRSRFTHHQEKRHSPFREAVPCCADSAHDAFDLATSRYHYRIQ